jgi:hypothetical protein
MLKVCLEKKSATTARQYLKPFEPVPCFSTNPLSVERGKKCIVQNYESMVDWKAGQDDSSEAADSVPGCGVAGAPCLFRTLMVYCHL